jgi:superfamily II DNA helicase RecQ
VCIVVSPLLSLIHDQLRMLPPGMAAVTLSGTMTRSKLAATLDDIARSRIKIVFVSPERLTSASFRRLFRLTWVGERRTHERIFPPVSLFCVDEAHTLSQWSHHFRPSYLRLRSIMAMIQPQSVLAITATAGPKVVDDICHILDIQRNIEVAGTAVRPSGDGIRVMNCDRDNIDISCYTLSSQEQRLSKVCFVLRYQIFDEKIAIVTLTITPPLAS